MRIINNKHILCVAENHLVYNALTPLLYLKWDYDIKIFCFDNFIHELQWYDLCDYYRTNALLIIFIIQYLYLLLYFLSSVPFNSVLYYLNSVYLYVCSNLYFSILHKKGNVRAFESFYQTLCILLCDVKRKKSRACVKNDFRNFLDNERWVQLKVCQREFSIKSKIYSILFTIEF